MLHIDYISCYVCGRMKHACAIVICVLAVLLACSPREVSAVPPPQCNPNFQQEDIPLRVRKVCAALSTFYELSNAMEAYLDDKGNKSHAIHCFMNYCRKYYEVYSKVSGLSR
jgi:hypothetical protein